MPNTYMDRQKAENLANAMLSSTGLSGFSYDTSFTLRFSRTGSVEFEGLVLPNIVELIVGAECWFDSVEKWEDRVRQFPRTELGSTEPAIAFELSSLRWTEGSEVEAIRFTTSEITIVFASGRTFSVSCEASEDFAWIVHEANVPETEAGWSVVCEGGELFYRVP